MVIPFPFPVALFSYPIFLLLNRSQIPTDSILFYLPEEVVPVEFIGLIDLD